jgi:hypothetical protein
MKERTQDLLFAACGVASVVVMLAGVAIGAAGGREFATATSSNAQITRAIATPAGNAVWVGAYLELLSFGLFIAFAMWACAKLGGGILGSIGHAAATAYRNAQHRLALPDGRDRVPRRPRHRTAASAEP